MYSRHAERVRDAAARNHVGANHPASVGSTWLCQSTSNGSQELLASQPKLAELVLHEVSKTADRHVTPFTRRMPGLLQTLLRALSPASPGSSMSFADRWPQPTEPAGKIVAPAKRVNRGFAKSKRSLRRASRRFQDGQPWRSLPNVVGTPLETWLAGEVPRTAIAVIRKVVLSRFGSGSVQARPKRLVVSASGEWTQAS